MVDWLKDHQTTRKDKRRSDQSKGWDRNRVDWLKEHQTTTKKQRRIQTNRKGAKQGRLDERTPNDQEGKMCDISQLCENKMNH